MLTESKKWQELCASGGHGVVRFDVFCAQCNKQLADNVDAGEIRNCGLQTDRPMEIFCDEKCASDYQVATGIRLFSYGWRSALP